MTASAKNNWGIIISLLLLGGVIAMRTSISNQTFSPERTNFTTFWLAGRMLLEDKNPYNEAQYLGEHDLYNVQWRPNKIFPYPLPLAILCVPFGLFSIRTAYLGWVVTSQIIVIITVFVLLKHLGTKEHNRLLVPIFISLTFFGPLYLTLLTGSIGALTLLVLLGVILLLERDMPILAGILLALTMLKPPQGVTILLLAGIWFLARRDWKAISGVALGGIGLFLVAMIQDPQWIGKFFTATQAVMDRTQGVHSNVWAFSYLACGGASPCSTLLGAAGNATLLGLGGFFLWKKQAQLSAWEAFNIIIPIGFVSTIYLWAYDQLPYIIPIVWIIGTLLVHTKSYIHAFIFLIALEVFSFYALAQQATTNKDLWSLGTTVIVFGTTMGLIYLKTKRLTNQPSLKT